MVNNTENITEEKQETERVYKIPEQGKDNSKENEQIGAESATNATKEMDKLDTINAKLDLIIAAQKINVE